jgi:hypothetical protein
LFPAKISGLQDFHGQISVGWSDRDSNPGQSVSFSFNLAEVPAKETRFVLSLIVVGVLLPLFSPTKPKEMMTNDQHQLPPLTPTPSSNQSKSGRQNCIAYKTQLITITNTRFHLFPGKGLSAFFYP